MVCWVCGDEWNLKKDYPKRKMEKGRKKIKDIDEEEDESTNLIVEYDFDAFRWQS